MAFVTHQTAAAHFKKHGLDIIMELERRERQQLLPWTWSQAYTRSWSMPYPALQSIPKMSLTGRMVISRPEPYMRVLTSNSEGIHPHFLDLNFTSLEERMLALSIGRERIYEAGRRVGHSMRRFAAAAALASSSMRQWSATIPPHPTLTQGPGKTIEPEGERHYDRKRILKDRKRKKLAKKSRRK